MSYEIHPASLIFPEMDDESFESLKRNISEQTQLEPIKLLDGKIIDGRHRYRACVDLGIEPIFEVVESCENPVAYVLSLNLERRHLNESQRAMIAARVKDYYAALAKERQREAGKLFGENHPKQEVPENFPEPLGRGDARDQAGAAVNVSGRSVDHASKVLTKGSPELIQAVDSGKVSVSKAAKIAATVDKEQQIEAATKKTRKGKQEDDYPSIPWACGECGHENGWDTDICANCGLDTSAPEEEEEDPDIAINRIAEEINEFAEKFPWKIPAMVQIISQTLDHVQKEYAEYV